MIAAVVVFLLAGSSRVLADTQLVTFDNAAGTTFGWSTLNDPVMGGKSKSTTNIDIAKGVAAVNGTVEIVPSLSAPGFVVLQSKDPLFAKFADLSDTDALVVRITSTVKFAGLKLSFAADTFNWEFASFKSNFELQHTGKVEEVTIPFSSFSNKWSSATGESTCPEGSDCTPSTKDLGGITNVGLWFEGVQGDFDIQLESIRGVKTAIALAPGEIGMEDFQNPAHVWEQKNDPVMGGQSTGTFVVQDGLGVFDGQVVDVPSLQAPGFIKVAVTDSVGFPDVSSCSAFAITAKASKPYLGFRLSVGNAHPLDGKFFASGHKARFDATDAFTQIVIPFDQFSDKWDDATGDIITTCAENKRYCLTDKILKDVKTMSVWAEGIGGDVHLEIESFAAVNCSSGGAAGRAASLAVGGKKMGDDICSGGVQSGLRYNMSAVGVYAVGDLPFPTASDETLADAICCDSAFEPFAEPTGLFARGDVDFFNGMRTLMDASGQVTFYDSVCGLPLYVAPRGRTFEAFMEDTTEHGWPSFRPEEFVAGNVMVDNTTGYVSSKCGTHLGTFLPDEQGDRHCIDTACVSGNPLA